LRLPEFDGAYEASRRLPDGPERFALLRKLDDVVVAYTPWILGMYSYANVVTQPWLEGYKQNPFQRHQWMYYAVAPH
jgi:ABC-type transport system substrate-binding protein